MTTPEIQAQAAGWTPDDSTFGARLALVRQRMGWGNVDKAARECGIPVETWRSWERDKREPHRLVTIAMAIATRTGCDYLWLVHGPQRGAIRTLAEISARVLTRRKASENPSTFGHLGTTRPVRQTRPLVDAIGRPRSRVSI